MTKPELRFVPMNDRSSMFILVWPGRLEAYYVGTWYPKCDDDCFFCASDLPLPHPGGVFYGSEFAGLDEHHGTLGATFRALQESVEETVVPTVNQIHRALGPVPGDEE